MSLSTPGVELEGFIDLPFLNYYNAWVWESRFTLGLNFAKNTDYFKQKLRRTKFPTKNSVEVYLHLLQ